jgi:hypothetical protein
VNSVFSTKVGGALFSDGYIRYIRFFRPIDPACAGLYAMREKELPKRNSGVQEMAQNLLSYLFPMLI